MGVGRELVSVRKAKQEVHVDVSWDLGLAWSGPWMRAPTGI
jgi:hypothetical protein